ncbi:hypothetical protein Taro_003690 [Colocasia esculenta]|uniref:3-ketoacyl-CoA synthase n=1 Tax=Colocasia esculenta TaxID=4460 RepID=A0A843TPN0_COLES|nr:hypothetical protein [Colocasia esculenta]
MEDHTLLNHAFSSVVSSLVSFGFLLSISLQTWLLLHGWGPLFQLLPVSCLLAAMAAHRFLLRPRHELYLVDFSCLRPPASLRVPISALVEHLSLISCFDRESVAFMEKVITSSGLGQETYFPRPLHFIPPKTRLEDSLMEAHMLLFPVMDDLLAKTGVSPVDVDVLVVNCSDFSPFPSLSAMVVHRYSMRHDVRTFNLSGMGCSASLIGVDVARALLAVHAGFYAVVLSAEVLSTGWYAGKDRRKLLLNCVFRTGSAAVLLTNRREARRKAKYRLARMERTQRAADDRAYASAIKEEDSEGITGFTIERDLLRVARETLRANAYALGASVLPLHEKARYALFWLRQAHLGESAAYMPDFKSSIQHFCLPASGKAVIREVGRGVGLTGRDTEAAAMTFHRFGNQSAASMWYQLAYMEGKGRVKNGDRVWQLGMGSGPKCNSAVWECLRQVEGEAERGVWGGCIHRYPMEEAAALEP